MMKLARERQVLLWLSSCEFIQPYRTSSGLQASLMGCSQHFALVGKDVWRRALMMCLHFLEAYVKVSPQ